jgi:ATP/maltotriose-dependent transcriptional regulator MalT
MVSSKHIIMSGGMTDMHLNGAFDEQLFGQELAVLREWDYIQQSLLHFASISSASSTSEQSRRTLFENRITQITGSCARIWWEPVDPQKIQPESRLIEIRYQQVRYGMLELAPGYLVSHLLPGIPQHFAHQCALLLYLAEHEELVRYLSKVLEPIYNSEAVKAFTPRERDVLHGLVIGESESEIAQRLGLEQTTVHTHIGRLYRRLEVRNAKDAILRSFALRLLDWLNLPR